MTWRPIPQPPCTEPCCTGGEFPEPDPWPLPVVNRAAEQLRECGVTGCISCDEVYQFIRDTDPDPAPPPGGGDRLPSRAAKNPASEREPGGVSTQRTPGGPR
jgi:hypothetical protein